MSSYISVCFNKEEYDFSRDQVYRMHAHQVSKKLPNIEKKPEYIVLKSLVDKFSKQVPELCLEVVVMDRRQSKFLGSLVKASYNIITGTTIPGYMARIDEKPEQAKFFKQYLDNAVKLKNTVLEPLIKKLGGELT